MRTLISLPDDDVRWLDEKASREGRSRAAVVREAVSALRQADRPPDDMAWLNDAFGVWARIGISVDPAEYDRKRRAESTRPWDDDYEEVRAESPDCFTEEDDREREHYLALTKRGGRHPSVP